MDFLFVPQMWNYIIHKYNMLTHMGTNLQDQAANYYPELSLTMFGSFLNRQFYAAQEGFRCSNLIPRAKKPQQYIQSRPNTSLIIILDISGSQTLEGHNSPTIALIGYYNHFSKMPTDDLWVWSFTSTLPSSFQTSSRHSMASNDVPPKIHSNFSNT